MNQSLIQILLNFFSARKKNVVNYNKEGELLLYIFFIIPALATLSGLVNSFLEKENATIFYILFGMTFFFSFLIYNRFFYSALLIISISFLVAIIPLLHWLIYKGDNNSYEYSLRLIENNIQFEEKQLSRFGDTAYVHAVYESANDSILNIVPRITGVYGGVSVHYIKNDPQNMLILKNQDGLHIYKDMSFPDNENLRYFFNKYFEQLRTARWNIKNNPSAFIYPSNFALESLTGFLFGEIKPISNAARGVRLIQLVFTFIFLLIVNKTIDSSKYIKLKNKKRDIDYPIEYHI